MTTENESRTEQVAQEPQAPAKARGTAKKAEAAEPAQPAETSSDMATAEPAPTPKPRKAKGKSRKSKAGANMTLSDLCARYLAHLEDEGRSGGTVFSYRQELVLACRELGDETPIASITREDVSRFYTCDRVQKLKSGKPKAVPSILKSQRVVRLALCWAAESGWIPEAPIPETESRSSK